MKQQSRFSQAQEQVTHQQASQNQAKEFATSDELLRFDAAHTPVPPEVAARLQKSDGQLRAPERRPWWKAWLGQ